jgi:hypothetical protein
MDLSNNITLNPGYLYFYEYQGIVAIGEFFEEYEAGYDQIDMEIGHYFTEVWSSDDDISYTSLVNDINILHEIGNAYTNDGRFNVDMDIIEDILFDLKYDFPEYFV